MTGEITLRGRVLPVGGIKEKLLAAHRAGLRAVILPADCERDLDDVPAEIREELDLTLVDEMDGVLAVAMVPEPAARRPSGGGRRKRPRPDAAAPAGRDEGAGEGVLA
jgi:ATP-dependent Lon protease